MFMSEEELNEESDHEDGDRERVRKSEDVRNFILPFHLSLGGDVTTKS